MVKAKGRHAQSSNSQVGTCKLSWDLLGKENLFFSFHFFFLFSFFMFILGWFLNISIKKIHPKNFVNRFPQLFQLCFHIV